MRKTGSVVVLILCLLFAFCALYAAEEVNQLGMHPFYKSRDLKPEDLAKIAAKYAEQVKAGFELAGSADLYDDFMAQLQAVKIDPIDVNPGDSIEWMIFKKNNKIEVKKDVVWTAKNPFNAYRFIISRVVEEDGKKLQKDFEFIVPKVCGNISLKSTKIEDITPPPPPPQRVNNPPTCVLTVTPDEIMAGQAVTMDASGSNDPDGSIASVKFVISKDGATIEEKVLTAAPFVYTTHIKKAGNIKIAAIVTDNEGLVAPGVCEKEITVLKRGFLIADVAILHQADPAWFLPIRAGYMHKLSKSIGIIILGGIAPVVSGDDDKTAILADLTLTYWPKSFFFGVGGGYFASSVNKRFDLIVNTGVQIMPHVSLFLEGRVGFDEFDVIDKFGRVGIGFRLKY